ncbi:MAG: ABC transporter ATP-binding protein/permease [Clostridia bacterium]|nr:ABC transporter ATP-binding protein/permease [Clostridia bacterium]
MIIVEHLTKIYKSKGKKGLSCVALNDVSCVFPDSGMIFILGKSGSGKSTLLNLLGGLDTLTSGDIIVNGNRLGSCNEEDCSNFRNSFVGFIFQDFCLIESFSVKENILFSTDLKNNSSEERLLEVAEQLDITDLLDRMPNELSGGQRQRVAIARAIIKNPTMILADEPTGNLDSTSAKQVLETLKSISKDNLVILVSHNPDDAYKYGDRIICIADGQIVSDVDRKEQSITEVVFADNEIIIPDKKRLSECELEQINLRIKKGDVTLKQSPPLFKETAPMDSQVNNTIPTSFSKAKLKPSRALGISYSFLKKKIFSFIFSTLMVSIIVIMFGLCQLFAAFSEEDVLNSNSSIANEDVFVMQKGYVNPSLNDRIFTDSIISISNDDIQSFYDNGYDGKIYKLYNYGLATSTDIYDLELELYTSNNNLYKSIFALENRGVLVCDEDFLKKHFGKDGELDYVIKSTDQHPGGVIITDYLADAILYYKSSQYKTYRDIVTGSYIERAHVNAIIDTGYKEKFKDMLSEFVRLSSNNTMDGITKLQELTASEEYIQMIEYVDTYLNIGYSLNPNFIEDSIDVDCRMFARIFDVELQSSTNSIFKTGLIGYYGKTRGRVLEKGQMYIPTTIYNDLFGTSLSDEQDPNFVPQTITLKKYAQSYTTGDNTSLYEMEFAVVGVIDKPFALLSDEDADFFRTQDIIPYALYFDNTAKMGNINTIGKEHNFVAKSGFFKALSSISETVAVFKDIFLLISICLCTTGTMVLISFGFSNIRKRLYEIGVMRALGTRLSDLSWIFILQMLFAGLIICLISSIGLFVAVDISNNILSESFMVLLQNSALKDFKIITFKSAALMIDIAVVIAITIVSALVPILTIRNIKPMKIIRAKE